MNSVRIPKTITLAFFAGVATPLATPESWLAYFFWSAGVSALVFACLAAGSAQDRDQPRAKSFAIRAVLWAAIGTDRPGARLADKSALLHFFAVLSYLAGLTVGAFAVVGM